MLQRNEGSLDRDIRLGLGLLCAFLTTFYAHGLLILIGIVLTTLLLVTSAVGFCPVYALLHIRTEHNS